MTFAGFYYQTDTNTTDIKWPLDFYRLKIILKLIYYLLYSSIDQNIFQSDTCFLPSVCIQSCFFVYWFFCLFLSHFCVCLLHALNYFRWHSLQSLLFVSPFYISNMNLYVSSSDLFPSLIFHFHKPVDNMVDISQNKIVSKELNAEWIISQFQLILFYAFLTYLDVTVIFPVAVFCELETDFGNALLYYPHLISFQNHLL